MAFKRRVSSVNIHESFSDVALLMLATFIFLLVTILITSRLAQENELPRVLKEVKELRERVETSEADRDRLVKHLENAVVTDVEAIAEQILKSGKVGKKDFDVFIQGLKNIPGKDLHLVVDATGSMHGISEFLVPILRLIVVRSKKRLSAITWFSDKKTETYLGSMGEMFDQLMSGAPFLGNMETIGAGFFTAASRAPAPGAYMLIGDEPSDDKIRYEYIPSPVFTLPMGRSNIKTDRQYETIAKKTGGKMLHLTLK